MTWVKLCGLSTRADVEAAVKAGADAVGFVVARRSVRRIAVETAAAIGRDMPIERYLVTVDMPQDDLLRAAEVAGVDGVQPHGHDARSAAEAAVRAGLRVLFPIGVGAGVDLTPAPDGTTPLLDTAVAGRHGGTGRSFDWSLVADTDRPFVLAGGLTPQNVAEAVATARPWGVDVSSGIERVPGDKDHDLMYRFVEAVR